MLFVDTKQVTAIRQIFNTLDRHQQNQVNVRDLILALRRDASIAKFLHLPMKITQEDPSRTTMQHIFNVIDSNHDHVISWHEFETYFFTHTYDVKANHFVENNSNSNGNVQQHSNTPRVSSPLARSEKRASSIASPLLASHSPRASSSPRGASTPSHSRGRSGTHHVSLKTT